MWNRAIKCTQVAGSIGLASQTLTIWYFYQLWLPTFRPCQQTCAASPPKSCYPLHPPLPSRKLVTHFTLHRQQKTESISMHCSKSMQPMPVHRSGFHNKHTTSYGGIQFWDLMHHRQARHSVNTRPLSCASTSQTGNYKHYWRALKQTLTNWCIHWRLPYCHRLCMLSHTIHWVYII